MSVAAPKLVTAVIVCHQFRKYNSKSLMTHDQYVSDMYLSNQPLIKAQTLFL